MRAGVPSGACRKNHLVTSFRPAGDTQCPATARCEKCGSLKRKPSLRPTGEELCHRKGKLLSSYLLDMQNPSVEFRLFPATGTLRNRHHPSNAGGSSQTTYRDASGRMTGSASTQPTTGASSRTNYRDATGRIEGTADTRTGNSSGTSTHYRDASGHGLPQKSTPPVSCPGTLPGRTYGTASPPAHW